jgi:hypothetical protein
MSGREPFEAAVLAPGVRVSRLVALGDDAHTAFVHDPSDPNAAVLRARSVVDLHGAHIGRSVVLLFEQGDPARPIVMGVLCGDEGWPLPETVAAGQVALSADGQRLVVSAQQQLVLRCGKASITLTRSGKVLIEGAYVSSRASGVNRVKGGAVQLN